ncbi:unnamed protein product [Rotaria socialis]
MYEFIFLLIQGTPESETVLLQALQHMRKQTSEQLYTMKHDKQFTDVDWIILNEYLPEKLVQEMDAQRRTSVHRRLSITPEHDVQCVPADSRSEIVARAVESSEVPTIIENDAVSHASISSQHCTLHHDFVLRMVGFRAADSHKGQNMRNELITRFLTALSVDYEKQWYIGKIRRSTLYILMESVEKAKHCCSLKLHWELLVQHCRFSPFLWYLIRFNKINWINKQLTRLLFDHIFLTIELILAFHSARTRMENIRLLFPELVSIDPQIWNEVYQETSFYHQMATYILLDLKESYPVCWRVEMTKRCAQMLLKYESTAIKELYQTGMLGETERSHILELIEKKLFNLEFSHVKMPKTEQTTIENTFDLLFFVRSIPDGEKLAWEAVMKSKHEWFQPGKVLIEKGKTVSSAYLIVRGVVQCEIDTHYIMYRSSNIIGIDALFSENLTAYGTYSVSGGLLEAYRIDRTLLNQLLVDDNIAPLIYCEIASHILNNKYQQDLKLNRLQVTLLLQNRAKFYRKQNDLLIHLEEYDRLFLVAGSISYYSKGQNLVYDSILFKMFQTPTDIFLDRSTVAYTWKNEDEIYLFKNDNINSRLSIQNFGSISNNLIYPRYSAQLAELSEY